MRGAHISRWRADPKQLFAQPYSDEYGSSVMASLERVLSGMPRGGSVHNRYEQLIFGRPYRYPAALMILSLRPFVEERSVFADNRLLDLYLSTPVEYRADPMLWIRALEKLDRDVAKVRYGNTGLSPFAPRPVRMARAVWTFWARKGGEPRFSQDTWPDVRELTRQNEKMKKLNLDTITDPDCLDPSLFDTGRIRELAGLHFSGKESHAPELLLLATFGRWNRLTRIRS